MLVGGIFQMDIGILEYQGYHSVYVSTLRNICQDHMVHFFDDVKKAQVATKELDVLFVNTIKPLPWDTLNWLRFKPKTRCKTIWTVHEVNTDFAYNKILLRKFDAISVPLQKMKEYIIEKKLYDGKIFAFPFMLHERTYPDINHMFVVPGKIEKFRRDYDVAFEMMNWKEPWCFLGEPIGKYGQQVLNKCKDMNNQGFNIKFFNEYVSDKEYEDILTGCKKVVAPLRNPTIGHNRLTREIYGRTKACGAMFEAVKYGKEITSNVPDIKINYKDFLLKDWKAYFNKTVLGDLWNV
jgi:hypothetical protein